MRVRPCGGRQGSGVGGRGCTRKEARRPKRAVRGGSRPQLQVVARCQARPCRRCFVGSVFRYARSSCTREEGRGRTISHGSTFLPPISKGNRARDRDGLRFPVPCCHRTDREREFRNATRTREREGEKERDTFFGKRKRRRGRVVGLIDVERKGCTRKDVDAALG